jgi:hypothetical protein
MRLPAFFARVPRLQLRDPLAGLLGSAEGGVLDYGYEDAVKLAGHSCPLVAATYWLTCRAMQALYPDELPERGGVRVEHRDEVQDGSQGVVALVVQLLTGAAGDVGLPGIAGRHGRRGLLRYAPELPLALRFTRLDNRQAIDAEADLSLLPASPRLEALLRCATAGRPSAEELRELGLLWQERVERLLCDLAWDDGVFVLRGAHRPWASPSPCHLSSARAS